MGTSSSREEVHERLSPPKEGEQHGTRHGDQDWLMASREQLCQTGSNSTDSGIQSVGEVQSPEDSEPAVEALSLVHRMWGGRMETSYTCLTCSATSSTSGWFTDLHLAIPSSSTSPQASTSKDPVPAPSTSPLTVPSLLKDYLTPERLEGENQYQCDNCRCKRD